LDVAARGCGGRGPLDWLELSGPSASDDSDTTSRGAGYEMVGVAVGNGVGYKRHE